jgi:uncharacterized 2Fe-2S/4Fe-4S cluster protein (DUF4445 family)
VKNRYKVTFEPDGKTVWVLEGTTIYEAIEEAGIIIKSECGGSGVCGSCKVKVIDGRYEDHGSDRFLSQKELEESNVLACRAEIKSDLTVDIPITSRLFEQKILIEGIEKKLEVSPWIQKYHVETKKPTLEDQRFDLDRILTSLKRLEHSQVQKNRKAQTNLKVRQVLTQPTRISLDVLRLLPDCLRENDFDVTVVLAGDEIIGLESGNSTERCYGVAFDIGTTTVVGYLLNLLNGLQLGVASRTNPQTSIGDDVVTRINYASTNQNGLGKLNDKIISCLNDIIDELVRKAGIERLHIYEITAVGNTTMNHLFLKLDPKYLALNPYVGVLREGLSLKAADIGIHINPYGRVYAMPNIAGFVGGDTVAVILASQIHKSKEIKFAIDIGTNGELVMGNRERLIACSTAAGPAFEGARITHGMRASDGAIEKVVIDKDDVEINTIGTSKPIGICGTALIDCIAELLKAGVIDTNGRMRKADELPENTPNFIKERVINHEKHRSSFVIVSGKMAQAGKEILLTQKDVRETQLAKGAIAAGYKILKGILGIEDKDIKEVLLAGAFGNYIRREQAKQIGLLPDIPTKRIKFIGNAAGSGAKMVLLSKELRKEALEISNTTEYVELAVSKDFQKTFAEAMFFPNVV